MVKINKYAQRQVLRLLVTLARKPGYLEGVKWRAKVEDKVERSVYKLEV